MLYFGGIGTRINFSDQLDNDIIPNRGSAARTNIAQIASPIARLHRFAGYVKRIRLPVPINSGRDRQSIVWGTSLSARLVLGGRRHIKTKPSTKQHKSNKN